MVTNDWHITAHISVLPSVKENHLCITTGFDFPEDERLTVCKNLYKMSFQEKKFTCRTTALSNTTQCKMTNSASVFCTAAVKEIWQKLNNKHFKHRWNQGWNQVTIGNNYLSENFARDHSRYIIQPYMSCCIRKPTICICENNGADQLCSNCTADQRLCFRYTDSTIPIPLKSEISSF